MERTTLSQIYSELSFNPDLPTLALRCNLLTEILLDCSTLPQVKPLCRCLGSYLEVLKRELDASMCDFYIVGTDDAEDTPQPKGWLLEDTQTLCDYSRALNCLLLESQCDRDMLPHLTGLLHDITHALADDLNMTSVHACAAQSTH
ncbi:hypothetical protein [Pseudenterobacter timonensis]|uniref:Uncharacterized protein n=1 Tax=Pseudenterobacter timonensis TaxID=1755099 RepID=A0ABV4AEL4_9ENTR